MAKRRPARKKMTLTIGEDPAVWRYASLAEAMLASQAVLAQLITSEDSPPAVEKSARAEEKIEVIKEH
ncbi:MAG: hypothetical protein K8I82_21810 [Anaerolineae bacterium]|nr:hypothetical protein [Anaerolineae bacterium]